MLTDEGSAVFHGRAIAAGKFLAGGPGRMVIDEEKVAVSGFNIDDVYRRADVDHVVVRRKYRLLRVPVIGLVGRDGTELRTWFGCAEWQSAVAALRDRGWVVEVQ